MMTKRIDVNDIHTYSNTNGEVYIGFTGLDYDEASPIIDYILMIPGDLLYRELQYIIKQSIEAKDKTEEIDKKNINDACHLLIKHTKNKYEKNK